MNLFRERKAEAKPDTPLWGLSGEDLKECVFVMMNTSFEEFVRIVEANKKIIEEDRKKRGLGEIGDLREWYRKTLGIPYLALSLMRFKRLEDVEVGEVGTYPLKPFFELSGDDVEELVNSIFNGYKELYKAVVQENKHLIPVILHRIAEDELREFYRRMGWKCNPEDLEYESCIQVYEEEWENEKGEEIGLKVYELSEMDLKLREAFEVLGEEDVKVGNKRIRDDLIKWNETFLEIITEKTLKIGKINVRMVLEALMAILFLELLGHKVDDDHVLLWLRECLITIPEHGMRLAKKGLEVARKDVFALSFLYTLAQRCSFDPRGEVLVEDVWKRVRDFEVRTEAEKALKIMAESSCLKTIWLLGLWLKLGLDVFKEFERLKNECKNLKNEFLRSYVSSKVLYEYAEVLLRGGLPLAKVEGVLKEAEEELKKARGLDLGEEGIELLKPLGGDPKVKANQNLDELESAIRFNYGRVLMNLGELDRAIEDFEVSKELREGLGDFVEGLKCESFIKRCKIIKGWEFGDKVDYDLFKKALELWHRFDLETKSGLCCEYAVTLSINGYSEKELRILEERMTFIPPEDLAITSGVLALLGEERLLKMILRRTLGDEIPLPNGKVKIEDATVEELKRLVVGLLLAIDLKIVSDFGLETVVRERIEIIEEYDKLLEDLKAKGLDEEKAKLVLGFRFRGVGLLEFVRDVYKRDKEKAEEIVLLTTTGSNFHDLIRILWLILSENIGVAYDLALSKAEYLGLVGYKLLSKLFSDLAKALREEDEKGIKTAIVKLFYLMI